MNRARLRIIKLGGSLLELDGLADAFRTWHCQQEAMLDVVVVGGGKLAEQIRAFQRVHGFDDATAHWLAIRCMSITAHLAVALLPGSRIVDCLRQIQEATDTRKCLVLEPLGFLRSVESRFGTPQLPPTWKATSDSIAAHVAEICAADELVLLKSALPADCVDWTRAADTGFVDAHFPTAVAGIRRAYAVNLAVPDVPHWHPSAS